MSGYYVSIAEGGGWPTHALGPFADHDSADVYMSADKWRDSWGGVITDLRDLKVYAPEPDTCCVRLWQEPDEDGLWRCEAA